MSTEADAGRTIGSVLVAGRGEIARRVFRTCRELGVATVAVHSDADADAPHAREADAAVSLPGDAPADTYLRGDLIVAAALAAGADAVHPGYGFLSENAGFARAVLEAGLVWIGPPPEAIEAMASKTRAKELMDRAGVPLLAPVRPGEAREEDLPLLVKAAAGGGGRGMRIVRELAALEDEVRAASAEAAAAFGDGEVFTEPYVERGRHVEVQVLADGHGTVWALGTRDCSLQRRHQKVIEEAPAPHLTGEQRAGLHGAAERAARAVGYRGAGTVEFLLAPDGRAYFLEMNTRLQVEHPVTECVYGLDLVALQLRIAEGAPLPAAQPPEPQGHAVEARLYAEDPARQWRPQTGRVHRLEVPGGPGVRLDAGVAGGDEVTVHYDPMLAKVIAWAPTRAEAVRKLAHALERAHIHGPATNRDLLVRSLRHPDFASGRLDTGFYDRHLTHLCQEPPDGERRLRAAAFAAALADAEARRTAARTVSGRLGGWRNLPSGPQTKCYRAEPGGAELEVRYRPARGGPPLAEDLSGVRALRVAADRVELEVDGVRHRFDVAAYPDGPDGPGGGEERARVFVDSPLGAYAFTVLPRFPDPRDRTEPGSLLARMPGTVVRLADRLAAGDAVTAGQPLLWLEAMKMEHRVTAPADGVLRELRVTAGQRVEVGAVLAVVASEEQGRTGGAEPPASPATDEGAGA
ncbi:biotin carboxylase N-terminal domain-containing protein [Streptomyces radiopugnans]|uniref:Propionyl-CoA carboxylase alpha chain n=1 Tax=Streptomyces radiopugnans TaxID=403935 RepID=A0A1H9FRH9_9ACTN|nr:biotin carboxylase N-terminal domain-containing protein [Streptomyces radiopugnans]SEQ40541.1 propionyl-CoA carboxylase alpha chain [Streptomyces radiopugnans]